jgi:hypothetical protein
MVVAAVIEELRWQYEKGKGRKAVIFTALACQRSNTRRLATAKTRVGDRRGSW